MGIRLGKGLFFKNISSSSAWEAFIWGYVLFPSDLLLERDSLNVSTGFVFTPQFPPVFLRHAAARVPPVPTMFKLCALIG